MRKYFQNPSTNRFLAAHLLVAVFVMATPITVSAAMSASIKANNTSGSITINQGDTFTYSWDSTDATLCNITAPNGPSAITLSGSGGPIDSTHPWYPTFSTPTVLQFDCTDGVSTASDNVTINLAAATTTPANPTADIKANGSDGPVTITPGSSYTYSWTSSNATLCNITAPNGPSAATLSGSGGPIDSTHPWYPTASSSVTLTFDCTNGTNTASDSVVINLGTATTSNPTVTADIKANGSDGPVTITNGDNFDYSWTSSNATLCNITAPNGPSAATVSGSGGPISLGHPWYPAVGSSTTLTLDCTNGLNTATDAVVINVVATTTPPTNPPSNPPGGGGGGCTSNCGSSRPPTPDSAHSAPGQVLGASTFNDFCPYLKSYLRIGRANDTYEVLKLQVFLKTFEGYDYVILNGVFDEATLQAVNAFQLKYQSEVLTPWGESAPTGYVYITTTGKINQILCGSGIPAVHPSIQKAPVKVTPAPCNCPCTCQMPNKEGNAGATEHHKLCANHRLAWRHG